MKVREIISQLDNPQAQLQAEKELISLGEKAIKELKAFLSSPPRSSSPAWIRAVDILIRIDKKAGLFLVDLLLRPWVTPEDTPERLAEEMLKDHIASSLKGLLPPQQLSNILLEALERFHLLGAARVLARNKDHRAIPFLLEMLEDDTKRRGAGEALLHYDERVMPHLIRSLNTPHRKRDGSETPSSLIRRKKIVSILALMPWEGSQEILEGLLDQKELALDAALALAQRNRINAKVINLLLSGLAGEDWFAAANCKEALLSLQEKALSPLLEALQDPSITPAMAREGVKILLEIDPQRAYESLSSLLKEKRKTLPSALLEALREGSGIPESLRALIPPPCSHNN